MYLLLPVAGSSSRYAGMRPKWLLTHPSGNLMFFEAFNKLNLEQVKEIILIAREDHYEEFSVPQVVERQLTAANFKKQFRVIKVPKTLSQPETVAHAIEVGGLDGPIYIKDSDNQFSSILQPGNRVAFYNLQQAGIIDAASKSYIELDGEKRILNIVEKQVVSTTFCVGGYGFASSSEYLKTFHSLENSSQLYVSHVIYKMLLNGVPFDGDQVENYKDWGTARDWSQFLSQFGALFIDLDGTLVENSAEYFAPYWGTTKAIKENVETVNKLYNSGNVKIIVTTSRTSEYKEITLRQLKQEGILFHDIIFDLPAAKRILVNDFGASSSFPMAQSLNIPRDSKNLGTYLDSVLRSQ